MTGFDYAYEETFSRHFKPRNGSWVHEDMLHWEKLEDIHPQKSLSLA